MPFADVSATKAGSVRRARAHTIRATERTHGVAAAASSHPILILTVTVHMARLASTATKVNVLYYRPEIYRIVCKNTCECFLLASYFLSEAE